MREAASMPRRLPAGCVEDRDRHGNIRIYYRVKGRPKVRLRGTPWTPEFMAAYDDAMGGARKPARSGIGVGTWRWLCTKYFAECADYKRLDPRTRHVRRLVLEASFGEPIAPGSPKFFRDLPLSKMTADAVEVLRDRKLEFPEAANARVKAIRQVFKFGVRKKFAPFNPARDVPYIRTGSAGITRGRLMRFASLKSGIRSERRHGLRWRCCVSPVRGDPTSFGSANNMRRAAS